MPRALLSALLGLAVTSAAFAGGTYVWPAPPPSPDTNPTATPTFPLSNWLNSFAQNLQNSRKQGKIDLLFDGDQWAITSGNYGPTGGMWQRYHKLNTFDFGNRGDTTQALLWRLQSGQVDGLHPRLIVLQIGSNNLSSNTPEQTAEGIHAVITEYQKRCPEAAILLQALWPRGEKPTDPTREKAKAVNRLIAPYADGKKVLFLDFGDQFLKPDGSLGTDTMIYSSYPTGKGYEIWAAAIQPIIDQFFSAPTPSESTTASTPPTQPAPIPGGTVTWPSAPLSPGANSALIPEPPMGWLDQFQKKIDESRQMPKVDLLFDGDSITAGWKGGGGGVWGHHYAKLNAYDFGNSGDTTNGVLWQVENGQVDGLHPKLIVLLIGTNNLGHATPEQLAEGITAVVHAYQKHCPGSPILLQGIFPRGEKPTDPVRDKIKAINQLIAHDADDKKVLFLDFGDNFLQPDGTISKDIMPDFLHPSPKGYQIWADAIQPIIDQFFPVNGKPAP